MSEDYVEINYSVRFIGINSASVDKLKRVLSEDNLESRKYYKDKSLFVVVYDLTEDADFEQLNLLQRQIGEGEKDIFVSIVSSSDSEIVDMPDHVQRFIVSSKLGVKISFTFTAGD